MLTGRALIPLLGSGFMHIVSKRVQTLSSTYLVASRHIKREKASLQLDARASLRNVLA